MRTSRQKAHGPRYRLLENTIIARIEQGELAPGSLLESPDELARLIDASASTIRLAFQSLASQGILVRIPGRGTMVSPDAMQVIRGSGSLQSSQQTKLFLIVPDICIPEYAQLAAAFHSITDESETEIVVCNTDNDPDRYHMHIGRCIDQQGKGLIMVPPFNSTLQPRSLLTITEARLPVITCWRQANGMDWPVVRTDPIEGGRILTQHLISQGCKCIALLTFDSPMHEFSKLGTMHGYMQAVSEAGYRFKQDYHASFPTIDTVDELVKLENSHSFAQLTEWITRLPEVDGIVCQHDILAIALSKALLAVGKSIPQDIRICGLGNVYTNNSLMHPGVTSYGANFRTFASRAATLIDSMHKGQTLPAGHHEIVPGVLIPGFSSSSAPKAAELENARDKK